MCHFMYQLRFGGNSSRPRNQTDSCGRKYTRYLFNSKICISSLTVEFNSLLNIFYLDLEGTVVDRETRLMGVKESIQGITDA